MIESPSPSPQRRRRQREVYSKDDSKISPVEIPLRKTVIWRVLLYITVLFALATPFYLLEFQQLYRPELASKIALKSVPILEIASSVKTTYSKDGNKVVTQRAISSQQWHPIVPKQDSNLILQNVAQIMWTEGELPDIDSETVAGRRMPLMPALSYANWRIPPADLKAGGEITSHTSFGLALKRLAQRPSVHLVLEVGTGHGGGSSWCLAQGLRSSIRDPISPDKWLFTVEVWEPAWEYAVQTLRRLPVTAVKGTSVGPEGFVKPEDLTDDERSKSFNRGVYSREVARAAAAGAPVLERLCGAYDFDLVVLDGSAYTRLAEYEVAERACRPRYLALHDTESFHTRQIRERLREQPGRWHEVAAERRGPGWAIYESGEVADSAGRGSGGGGGGGGAADLYLPDEEPPAAPAGGWFVLSSAFLRR